MQYTLKDRLHLMTKGQARTYLVLELDRSKINGNTFYSMTANVQLTFGSRKFTYTWLTLSENKLVLLLAGNEAQLDFILKYLNRRHTTQLIYSGTSKVEFRAIAIESYALASNDYPGALAIGGTHFARKGVAL